MKKFFKWLFIAGVLLVIIILILPFIFKNKIIEAGKQSLVDRFNVRVESTGTDLTLFKNFPDATIVIENLSLLPGNISSNDTLLYIYKANITADLSSLLRRSGVEVKHLELIGARLFVSDKESGKLNWSALSDEKKSGSSKEVGQSSSKAFRVRLEQVLLDDADFIYESSETGISFILKDLNLDISGDMYGPSTLLSVDGKVGEMDLSRNETSYLSGLSLSLSTILETDFKESNLVLTQSELELNQLPLQLDGTVNYATDSLAFDLGIQASQSDFTNFLNLIPAEIRDYLKDYETSGKASVEGQLKGFVYQEQLPAFSFQVDIDNGRLQYVNLPESIDKVSALLSINKPQGKLDLLKVMVKDAHAEVRNNPIDLTLSLSDLFSDPSFDGAFIGKLNLDDIKDAVPIKNTLFSGIVDANLFVNGKYSALEKEEYDKVHAEGIVLLDDFIYQSEELNKPVRVPKGLLDFTPESINLKELQMNIGQSDFFLTGWVGNYFSYFFRDGILNGQLNHTSQYIDFNELLRLRTPVNEGTVPADASTQGDSNDTLAFLIPDNLDLTFQSNIQTGLYENLPLTSINGKVTVLNETLRLNGIRMNLLDGTLFGAGTYRNTLSDNKPSLDFEIQLKELDIPMAYRSLVSFRKLLPIAGQSTGRLSSVLKINTRLSESLKIIPATVSGTGALSTHSLLIKHSAIFNQLKGILKSDRLTNVAIKDFESHFKVDHGSIELKPFETEIAGQQTTGRGKLSVESILDLRLDFLVEREAFGPDIQNILSMIPGNKNLKLVPAGVDINGPVNQPQVEMDLRDTKKAITNATRDDLQKSLEKIGKGLKNLFEK